MADLDNLDLYFGISLKKLNIGSKTRDRLFQTRDCMLFLAAACFSAKFICIFRNISRNRKVVTAWFKQGTAYILSHFQLFIFFLAIKNNSGDINLVLQIVINWSKYLTYEFTTWYMLTCLTSWSWWQTEIATRMTSILR